MSGTRSRLLQGFRVIIDERDGNEVPYAGVVFWKAGKSDPAVVFADPEMTHAHSCPLICDNEGKLPPIYIGPDPVDVTILTPHGDPAARYSAK